MHSEVTHQVLACAYEVHRLLGPGLLENSYKACLCRELRLSGVRVGLLINFNVTSLKNGIRRFIRKTADPRPSKL